MEANNLDRVVVVDVGGKLFKTRVETLARAEYFHQIFVSPHWARSNDDRTSLFVDRCPGLFKHVLRLLRDTNYALPEKCLSELDFYGICWDKPATPKTENVALVDFSLPNLAFIRGTTGIKIGSMVYEKGEILALLLRQASHGCMLTVYSSQRSNNFVVGEVPIDQVRYILESLLDSDGELRSCLGRPENDFLQSRWFYFPDRIPMSSLRLDGIEVEPSSTWVCPPRIPDLEFFHHYVLTKRTKNINNSLHSSSSVE